MTSLYTHIWKTNLHIFFNLLLIFKRQYGSQNRSFCFITASLRIEASWNEWGDKWRENLKLISIVELAVKGNFLLDLNVWFFLFYLNSFWNLKFWQCDWSIIYNIISFKIFLLYYGTMVWIIAQYSF